MFTGLTIAFGLTLLFVFAICIGTSLDTEMQRRERKRLAVERHLRWSAQQQDHHCPTCCGVGARTGGAGAEYH